MDDMNKQQDEFALTAVLSLRRWLRRYSYKQTTEEERIIIVGITFKIAFTPKVWLGFSGKSSRMTWLFGIAKNALHDYIRNKAKYSANKQEFLDNTELFIECTKSKRHVDSLNIEETELMEMFKLKLTPKQLEVLGPRLEGKTYKEIAAELSLTVTCIRERLSQVYKAAVSFGAGGFSKPVK